MVRGQKILNWKFHGFIGLWSKTIGVIEFVGYLGMWLVEVDCPLSELADQFPDEECTGSSLSHFLLANPIFPFSLSLTDADVDVDSTFLNCFNRILPQSFNKSRLDLFSVTTTVVLLDTMSSESLLLSDKPLQINKTYDLGTFEISPVYTMGTRWRPPVLFDRFRQSYSSSCLSAFCFSVVWQTFHIQRSAETS